MARAYRHTDAGQIVVTPLAALLDPAIPRNRAYRRTFLTAPDYRLTDDEIQEPHTAGRRKIFLNSIVGIVENGRLVRAWGTQRDITARREPEIALAENAASLIARWLNCLSCPYIAPPTRTTRHLHQQRRRLTHRLCGPRFFTGVDRYSTLIRPEEIPFV